MPNLNLKDIQKEKKLSLTWANLVSYGVITQAKADIATHPAKRKVIVGGKGTGKTHIPNVKAIIQYEQNEFFNAFGFRKYKEAAYDSLGSYFSATLSVIRARGFKTKLDYEMRSYNFYRMKDKRNMLKNQIFRFGSLEDASGSTDGKAPANGGYFGLIEIDEPVVKQDVGNPDKIPTKDKFNEDMDIIRDNLERYNDTFEDAFPDQPKPIYEEFFTMNDWGNHPLTIKCQEVLPVEEFAEYNFGYSLETLMGNKEMLDVLFEEQEFITHLMTHNTMSKYVPEEDTLYSRMTKFANPANLKEKRAKPLINKIRMALEQANMNALAIMMGYRHEGNTDSKMAVYNIKNIEHATIDEFIEEGFKIKDINYAWDIDTSRVLTLTPGVLLEKRVANFGGEDKVYKRVLIDRQIEVPAYGTGEIGEMNDVYVNIMAKAMTKHYKALPHKPKKARVSIDDKRKWYLHEIYKKSIYFLDAYKIVEQHGVFDIAHRQDAMVNGFENSMLYNHPKNKALELDLKVCVKRDINDSRRKTTGSTNYLDRIDSAEYSFEPYTGTLWKKEK